MADRRKLQAEIDRCLKKVEEGCAAFDDLWTKVQEAPNSNQKERFEQALKKEIKKLQRDRDQIKTWQTSSEVRTKDDLSLSRGEIENRMEKFKQVERETKMKPFSKEGLQGTPILDPVERAKMELQDWLKEMIEKLQQQTDKYEADMEVILAKKKKPTADDNEKMELLKSIVSRHRFHSLKLEATLRAVDNELLDHYYVKGIKDNVEYYIETNEEMIEEDIEQWRMTLETLDPYEDLDLDDAVSGLNPVSGASPSPDDVDVESPTASVTGNSPSPSPAPSVTSSKKQRNASQGSKGSKQSDNGFPTSNVSPTSALNVTHTNGSRGSKKAGGGGASTAISSAATVLAPPPPSFVAAATGGSSHTAPLRRAASQPLHTTTLPSPPEQVADSLSRSDSMRSSSTAATPSSLMSVVNPFEAAGTMLSPADLIPRPSLQPQPLSNGPVQSRMLQNIFDSRPAMSGLSGGDQRPQQQQQLQQQQQQQQQQIQQQLHQQQLLQQQQQQHKPAHSTASPFSAFMSSNDSLSQRFQSQTSHSSNYTHPQLNHSLPPGEMHITPAQGVAPLGKMTLTKQHQDQRKLLEFAVLHIPSAADTEKVRPHLPRSPCPTPAWYPQTMPEKCCAPEFWNKLPAEVLFFSFYYLEGTKAQMLAANSLKGQSWRFHTQFNMWFQRAEQPDKVTATLEIGSYYFFDYSSWKKIRKENFTFEYKYLEDRTLVAT